MSPRIPEYQRNVGLTDKGPAVEVDARSYGMMSLAQAELFGQVGKAAGKMSDLGFDINEKMVRAQTVDQFSNMNAAYTKGLYELREAVKGGNIERNGVTTNFSNDPSTWQANFESEHAKLLEQTMAMGTIPGAQLAFKRHASMIFPAQLHGVMTESRKQTIENIKGNLEANLQIYQDAWPKAQTEMERVQLSNSVERSLEEAVAAHVIVPKMAEVYKKKFGIITSESDFSRSMEQDPWGTRKALDSVGAFNFSDKRRMHGKTEADQEIHKKQTQTYEGLASQFIQNTDTDGSPKGPIPTESQIKDLLKGDQPRLNPGQAHTLMGFVKRSEHNPENKPDRESTMAIGVRMTETDPEKLLTREEYLGNVNGGTWKVTAAQFSHDLHEIAARDSQKIPKAMESAINNSFRRWPNEFRGGPTVGKQAEEYQMAVSQVRQKQADGEFEGLTPKQVQADIDEVFKTQLNDYLSKSHIDPTTRQRMQRVPGQKPGWVKSALGWETTEDRWEPKAKPGQTTSGPAPSSGARPWTQGTTGIRNEGGWR